MQVLELHPWRLSPQEAIEIQKRLTSMVVETGDLTGVRFVAGIDVAAGPPARAAVVVLDTHGFRPVEVAVEEGKLDFPYIPGLLSFREAPLILQALKRIEGPVDALLVDGQGRAHPRRFGIACHIGLLVAKPSVGCGKSLLVGGHAALPLRRGSWAPIVDRGEIVGAAVRTREGTKPVYVSVGHMVSLEAAVRLVLTTSVKYRLPEPIRWAHRIAAGSTTLRGDFQR
jgi:deoxyribonuclease V